MDTRNPKIEKAEEGLDEMQVVLDHAKRAVDAADKADQAVREAVSRGRSRAGTALVISGVVVGLLLIGALLRRRR